MRILKTTDKVTFTCGDISVTASPLSYAKKSEVAAFYKPGKDGALEADSAAVSAFLVSHSVKGITGVKNMDDSDYELSFKADGSLSDESLDVVMTALTATRAVLVPVLKVAQQQLPTITNPENGEVLEGVSMSVQVSGQGKPPAPIGAF